MLGTESHNPSGSGSVDIYLKIEIASLPVVARNDEREKCQNVISLDPSGTTRVAPRGSGLRRLRMTKGKRNIVIKLYYLNMMSRFSLKNFGEGEKKGVRSLHYNTECVCLFLKFRNK